MRVMLLIDCHKTLKRWLAGKLVVLLFSGDCPKVACCHLCGRLNCAQLWWSATIFHGFASCFRSVKF